MVDDPLSGQHPAVGHRALDVVMVEALVELDRGGEFLDELVGRLGEASSPEFFSHDAAPANRLGLLTRAKQAIS